MAQFIVQGGRQLHGQITVNSSKNAAVAIIMAALINRGETTLKNIPRIEEVNRLLELLQSLGVKVARQKKTLVIQPPKKLNFSQLDKKNAQKTRIIILALSAWQRFARSYQVPQASGCKLGSRTVKPHLFALENFGYKIETQADRYTVRYNALKPASFALYESGDTVTENALLAAAQIPGKSTIKFATANYMVQDLCFFLQKLGVRINGLGTSTLEIYGQKNIHKNITYAISEDPIEAMLFLSAAIVTNSSITIKRCPIDFLELELLKLKKMGLKYHLSKKYKAANGQTDLVDIRTNKSQLKALAEKIHALPFPGINQDNLPFFVPIATAVRGETFIHDWAYEERAIYYTELNKLGANVTLIDNHRVTIKGPTKLKNAEVICPPALRPAAIILVAMLSAQGTSILRNVYPIHRGYEALEERLKQLGAEIDLVENEK